MPLPTYDTIEPMSNNRIPVICFKIPSSLSKF